MATLHRLAAALCLMLAIAPAAWAQEEAPELPAYEEDAEMPAEEAAPPVSPAELKKQLQGLKSDKGGMAGVQELARIARSIKANNGAMSVEDVKSLRLTLGQLRHGGTATREPLFADMLDQLDAALARMEKQIADPDGWMDEEMPTE